MNRKPEVPEPAKSEIDRLLGEAGRLRKGGDMNGSLHLALEAWRVIPEPKSSWDYYPQSLSVSFLRRYTDMGDVEKAKHWIGVAYEMYDDPSREGHYILMFEASSLFKLGLKDEAYDVIDRIYGLYGREGFKGEHLDYLEFYLKERARRRG